MQTVLVVTMILVTPVAMLVPDTRAGALADTLTADTAATATAAQPRIRHTVAGRVRIIGLLRPTMPVLATSRGAPATAAEEKPVCRSYN